MKKTFDAQAQARPHIRRLQAYVPGEQPQGEGWIKLNTNELPYPPSPKIREVLASEWDRLRKYPEPTSARLRTAIGRHYGFSEEHVIIGNGSDNILDLITRCFVSEPGIGHTVPSYSLYPVLAGMSGQKTIDVDFDRSIRLDIDAIAGTRASVFFLTNPNAPTGVVFPRSQIEALLQTMDGLLVVDEAYVDFSTESSVDLLNKYENLIVVRTFSKSYGLAGIRVGFALACTEIIRILDRVRDAYNVDRIAQAVALAAFEDFEYFDRHRRKVIATREATFKELNQLNWFTYPSGTNFLFTEPKNRLGESGSRIADDLFNHLKAQKILVRYFPENPLTCTFIRVSIGTEAEMRAFLAAARSWHRNV